MHRTRSNFPQTLSFLCLTIQVLASFMLSSLLTILVSSFTLLLQHNEHLRHLGQESWMTRRLHRYPQYREHGMGHMIKHLELFVLALSDQQLLTGYLLLVVAFIKYWNFSVTCGGNNMWDAIDVGCFSSLTHAATLLTLRSYFRRHRILATVRFVSMCSIYILLLVGNIFILKPLDVFNNRPKLSSPMTRFWHGTSYVEIFGILALYLATYLPILLPRKTMRVRICLAINAENLPEALKEWHATLSCQCHDGAWAHTCTRAGWLKPFRLIRCLLTRFGVCISKWYITAVPWTRAILWICCEIMFPFGITPVLLFFLWLYGLGFMCLKVAHNNLPTSWSFGQLLPVFLVFLPFATLIGSIAGERLRY